ncbi:hypothetical protein EVAR_16264_1 [Eumeta japonica]|uniref:Uncharacterized protein n=1 Tax=Eumeta variegata TaxID=151549 RepID=A0A4C1U6Z0_EUMVA|nr:hypothetical protein EVAR_16264_1 [Eumeta japonica]
MSHRAREGPAECLASLSHSTMIGLPRAQRWRIGAWLANVLQVFFAAAEAPPTSEPTADNAPSVDTQNTPFSKKRARTCDCFAASLSAPDARPYPVLLLIGKNYDLTYSVISSASDPVKFSNNWIKKKFLYCYQGVKEHASLQCVCGHRYPWTLATSEESPVRHRPFGYEYRFAIGYPIEGKGLKKGSCGATEEEWTTGTQHSLEETQQRKQ